MLDTIFRRVQNFISLERLDDAFDLADINHDLDGDPLTAWGLAQGITRLSQTTPFADERAKLDRAAGKALRIAF